jgi:hypothetical protein
VERIERGPRGASRFSLARFAVEPRKGEKATPDGRQPGILDVGMDAKGLEVARHLGGITDGAMQGTVDAPASREGPPGAGDRVAEQAIGSAVQERVVGEQRNRRAPPRRVGERG